MRSTTALPAALALLGPAAIVLADQPPGGAAGPADERYCRVEIQTRADVEAGKVAEPVCFDTFAKLLSSLGVAPGVAVADSPAAMAAESWPSNALAAHYEGLGGSGSYIVVVGNDCTGGGLNLSPDWNDRIRSTRHLRCGTIKHWRDWGLQGPAETTSGSYGTIRNLTTLDQQVTSIQYYA
ncbi:hypothetical protein [Rhabdothermincola sp.]|uniref:hypothetical protein n=1 Tax=Rhabdothermincola sp. TaxID=2820405 RepID=UPI002FE07E94